MDCSLISVLWNMKNTNFQQVGKQHFLQELVRSLLQITHYRTVTKIRILNLKKNLNSKSVMGEY